MLSNIHTVKAIWNPQEEKTWKFAPKAQTANNSLFHQTCTVRIDSNDPNVGMVIIVSLVHIQSVYPFFFYLSELLFELGVTFKREVWCVACTCCTKLYLSNILLTYLLPTLFVRKLVK